MFNKDKIKMYAGAVLVSAAILATGVGVYEVSVDHNTEYCHLCDVIGLKHQANAINRASNSWSGNFALYYPKSRFDSELKGSSLFDPANGHVLNNAYELYQNVGQRYMNIDNGKGYILNEYGILTDKPVTGERVEVYFDRGVDHKLLRTIVK